jgi:hypothetical protein
MTIATNPAAGDAQRRPNLEMTMFEQMEARIAAMEAEVVESLHLSISAAIAHAVKGGASEKDAFRNHMKQLAQEHPRCWLMYFRWLAAAK